MSNQVRPFPHHYEVALRLADGRSLLEGAPRPPITGGPPPQFGGTDAWWSPEQLLLAAVDLCLLTTFQAFAAREKLTLLDYRDRIEGVLEKTAAGPRFTSITHHVTLEVAPEDRERAARLLDTAKRHCIIAASLNVPVQLDFRVTSASAL
jgi:organic hydroperoxide reductase OsmC/OhrA